MALREVYQRTDDPELKLKLRYAATLSKAMADRLYQIDSKWLMEMYPSVEEYDKLMREDSNG